MRIKQRMDKDLLFPRMWSKYLNFHRQSALPYLVSFICCPVAATVMPVTLTSLWISTIRGSYMCNSYTADAFEHGVHKRVFGRDLARNARFGKIIARKAWNSWKARGHERMLISERSFAERRALTHAGNYTGSDHFDLFSFNLETVTSSSLMSGK